MKLSIYLYFDTVIQSCVYPREVKTHVHKNIFLAALFIIAKAWKQLMIPSVTIAKEGGIQMLELTLSSSSLTITSNIQLHREQLSEIDLKTSRTSVLQLSYKERSTQSLIGRKEK